MRFINLASSSDGNCTYISDGKYNILIDCGITYKQIKERLQLIDVAINDIDAIFITHGHIDHIRGLDTFMRQHLDIKIFGHFDSFIYIDKKYPCKYDYDRFFSIDFDKVFDLSEILGDDCNIKITPSFCPHDAPCAYYKISIEDKNLAILTDCGYYDKKILNNLLDVDYLMLESNYDEELIETSIYPRFLIERIKGKGGHLSNDNAVSLLLSIINKRLDTVCLSHISHNSNNENNAYDYVTTNINNNISDKTIIPNIIVASRVKPTVIVDN